ncbi:MAG: ComEC/Rec2 family competence protein [Muribaculaceae bacterium]|nr:ComEC/Rec2 family competence protein [Muribaculaceae bacterium]
MPVQAPWSRIPAVPAAIGFAGGILSASFGASVWVAALAACVGAALWLWRPARFFASLPVALAIGFMAAACEPRSAVPSEPPAAREGLLNTIYTSPLDGPAAAFVATTVVADSRYLAPALRDDFRGAGIAHILALSGFHAGIVAMLVMWLTRPMLAAGRARMLRPVVVLAAVWAFAALGGFSPSIVRASVMLSLLSGARLLGRYTSTLNALAVAALAILAWRPSALFDVGFLLSFGAVGGILAFAGPLNPFDRRTRPRLHAAASLVAVPLGATLATAPVVAGVFGSLPLMFLPANMLVAVLFAPFYVVALAVVLLSACGLPCALLARLAEMLYALMATAADSLASSISVAPSVAAVATFYFALVSALILLRRHRPRAG